jgi:hypothetical protein
MVQRAVKHAKPRGRDQLGWVRSYIVTPSTVVETKYHSTPQLVIRGDAADHPSPLGMGGHHGVRSRASRTAAPMARERRVGCLSTSLVTAARARSSSRATERLRLNPCGSLNGQQCLMLSLHRLYNRCNLRSAHMSLT